MKRALVAGLLAALAVAAPVHAQQSDLLELQVDDVNVDQFPEVVATVTVPTEMVSLDLTPQNFFVSLDGEGVPFDLQLLPPEELQIALLIDTSGSMEGAPLSAAKNAVGAFVETMPEGVELALFGFGETSELIVPFTTDQEEILGGVSRLSAGGETALYDGLIDAAAALEEGSAGRRTIVLLTDGGDTASAAELDDALLALIQSDARLVIVELESPESDRAILTRMQATTGGSLVAASDPEALDAIYAEVASDLVNQYEVTFQAQPTGTTDLVIAIRTDDVTAQGAVVARFPEPPPPSTTDPSVATTITSVPTVTTPIIEVAAVPVDIVVPWYATTSGLLMGAAAVFIALSLILLLLVPSRRGAMRVMASMAGMAGNVSSKGRLSDLTNKATLFAEETINRGRGEGRLRLRLDQAGLRLREGEFLLLVFSVLLVAVVGGFLFGGIIWAFALGAIVVFAASSVLKWLGSRRAEAFRHQLPDSLQLISGSLRAGFGLNQAITAVANEQEAPASEEFARAQLEVHLGRDVEDALRNMATRVQSEDLPWVAEAIEIHREIGGDVADLLDQIAATVRERERIRGQIQVLAAEGKISGIVLVALPFVIAGMTFSVAPDYLQELTRTVAGKVMLAGGSSAMLIGIFWIRRIIRLEF